MNIERERNMVFPLPEDLFNKMNKYVPFGMKKHVMTALIEALVRELERDAASVLADILQKRIDAARLLEINHEPPKP